jgi:Cdc6-like AAA superfamily ATPase
MFTKDQEYVFSKIKDFFQDSENPAIVIKGSAGTGKTYLTKYIVDHIMDNLYYQIVAIAPTHKARRVLSKMLNKNRLIEIPTSTIAAILSKLREHSYIGAHH